MPDRNIVIIDEAQCQFVVAELDEKMKVIERFGTYPTEDAARQAYPGFADGKVNWHPEPGDCILYRKENRNVLVPVIPGNNRVFLQD